ncbi:MAG: hypothetical protein OJF50_006476 [Nitrospira sp.]|jgi:hypothetical protein|nr:hypothetical protein [Nitrospira sp.]
MSIFYRSVAVRIVSLVGVLLLGAELGAAQVSPLNLSPGYPGNLDDAYPINPGAIVAQPSLQVDKQSSNDGRLRMDAVIRWGAARNIELFAGGVFVRGPLFPGSVNDPRAIQTGLLYRIFHQPDQDSFVPSLAVRSTVQIPYEGPQTRPALRNELLASWDLSGGWYAHANFGYQVVPGGQAGLLAPGVNSVWMSRVGVVKGFRHDVGVMASVGYGQDPNQSGAYAISPEAGVMWSILPDWILTMGVGRDFGSGVNKTTIRANLGISKVW